MGKMTNSPGSIPPWKTRANLPRTSTNNRCTGHLSPLPNPPSDIFTSIKATNISTSILPTIVERGNFTTTNPWTVLTHYSVGMTHGSGPNIAGRPLTGKITFESTTTGRSTITVDTSSVMIREEVSADISRFNVRVRTRQTTETVIMLLILLSTGILSRQWVTSSTAARPTYETMKQGTTPVRTTPTGSMGDMSNILTAFTLPLCMTDIEATTVYTKTKTSFTTFGMKPHVDPTRGPHNKRRPSSLRRERLVEIIPRRHTVFARVAPAPEVLNTNRTVGGALTFLECRVNRWLQLLLNNIIVLVPLSCRI